MIYAKHSKNGCRNILLRTIHAKSCLFLQGTTYHNKRNVIASHLIIILWIRPTAKMIRHDNHKGVLPVFTRLHLINERAKLTISIIESVENLIIKLMTRHIERLMTA